MHSARTRVAALLMLAFGFLWAAYFAWSVTVLDEISSVRGPYPEPRGFPYPDTLIKSLFEYHVTPPPEGCGPGPYWEVRRELIVVAAFGGLIALAGVALLWWSRLGKRSMKPPGTVAALLGLSFLIGCAGRRTASAPVDGPPWTPGRVVGFASDEDFVAAMGGAKPLPENADEEFKRIAGADTSVPEGTTKAEVQKLLGAPYHISEEEVWYYDLVDWGAVLAIEFDRDGVCGDGATFSEQTWCKHTMEMADRVERGMSKEKVKQILGAPTRVRRFELWSYRYRGDPMATASVRFEEGKVVGVTSSWAPQEGHRW